MTSVYIKSEHEKDVKEQGDGQEEPRPGHTSGQKTDRCGEEPRDADRYGQHPGHIVEDDGAAKHIRFISPAVFAVLAENDSVGDCRYR